MTAQNTLGVSAIAEVPPDFVSQQLEAVLTDLLPDSAKTGMLLTDDVIEAVAHKLQQYRVANLIVDPVLVSSSGAMLMQAEALKTFRRLLLPLAALVTPNLDEAGTLTGKPVHSIEEMERAAREIHAMGARNVLVKGGHLTTENATDVFFDGANFTHLAMPRCSNRNTHGTGCVLSASIAAYCALGQSVPEAVASGKKFVTDAINNALDIGNGIGPCDPLSLGG
jgi:hydroxymethylpyrimidine kinase/phosphomethylpyrimidine kinase